MSLKTERIESIKSGIVGAAVVAIAFLAATSINQWVLAIKFASLTELTVYFDELNWFVSEAIACLSGFLFGVTYRYIIRTDNNYHLQQGSILAFGLVRGLAQLDDGLKYDNSLQSSIVLCFESILLFAIAGVVLDWAIRQGWIGPFK